MSLDPGLPRLRFSLLTLVIGVLFVGACFGIWWRWEPWVCSSALSLDAERVEAVLFSPDERFLVASTDRLSCVGRITGAGIKVAAELPCRFGYEVFGGFSDDGSLLALSQKGGDALLIWSAETTSTVSKLEADGCVSACGDWAPDNRRLVTAGHRNIAVIWDACTGRLVARLEGHSRRIQGVCFSPDGHRVATASGDGTVRLWDAETGKELVCLKGHDWACAVAFSPDGRQVATVDMESKVRIWNAETGALVKELGHPPSHRGSKQFAKIDFLPDGKHMSGSGTDGRVRTWDVGTGELTDERNGGLSPDGRRTAREVNGRAYVLDTSETREYSIPRSALAELGELETGSAVFSPTGKYIATGHEYGSVRLWVRRRPEWWWGIAWLQEFWVAMVSGCALVVIAARNLRRSKKPAAAPSQQPVADRL